MSRRRSTKKSPRAEAAAQRKRDAGSDLPKESEILDALRGAEPQGLRTKELARAFGVKGTPYRELRDLLRTMQRDGRILKLRGGRLAAPSKERPAQVGRLTVIRSGAGFVAMEGATADVFVPADALRSAMHGDTVEVTVEPARAGRRASGRVVRVVERNRSGIVGVVRGDLTPSRRPGSKRGVVEIGGRGPARMLEIAPAPDNVSRDADTEGNEVPTPKDGDVVLMRVSERGARGERLAGQIVEVLGSDDDPRTDSLQVIRAFGLSEEFPERVRQEVLRFADEEQHAGDEDIQAREHRKDCTGLHVLTIDPADARDHDDALSVTTSDGGRLEVGVHIADVSFYVRPGTAVDAEAKRRGTSTYLVDRAVPMLPEVLSSDVCSLKAGRDRRALSLFFTMKPNGTVLSTRLERTWVRPKEVLSYETAQEILEGAQSASSQTVESLHTLRDLAEILRIRRVKRGALDFDLPEAHVVLSPDGRPLALRRRLRLEVHRIIEEWMLVANETIARRCQDEGLPVLYRVHESPDEERLETLSALAATNGHDVPRTWSTRALQQLLDATRGKPEEGLIHGAVLRAMRRATYEAGPDIHFGLAVEPYAHFTSPIRRYPDLQLHQALDGTLLPALDGEGKSKRKQDVGSVAELARHVTDVERVADEAGRESVALARLRFMAERVGDEFSGTISRVLAWGFFVTLDDEFVDGLVHVRSLPDHYSLDEASGILVGERHGLTFRVGDPVMIRVARVNRMERQIDFELIDAAGTSMQPSETSGRRKPGRRGNRKARRSNR